MRKCREKRLGLVSELTKADAANMLRDLIAQGNGPEARMREVTLEEFIKNVYIANREKHWRPKWKKNLESLFKNHFYTSELARKQIRKITRADCQRFVDSIADKRIAIDSDSRPISKSIVHKCRTQLRRILAEASAEELVEKNHAELLDEPSHARRAQETQPLEFSAMASALAITGRYKNKQDHLILKLSLGVGLRPGETFALRAKDVQTEQLIIDESVVDYVIGEPKTLNSAAPVAITPELELELRQYVAERHLQPDDFLFTYATGKPISQNNYVQRQLKTIGKQIGVPDLNFRMLRTSFATYVAQHGGTPKDLQTALRHSDPVFSIRFYQKPIPDSTRKMQTEYDAMLRKAVRAIDSLRAAG